MSAPCRKIQEGIEQTRRELREKCKETAKTVSERICRVLPWPLTLLCDVITQVVTVILCVMTEVIIVIISWVTRVVCELFIVLSWLSLQLLSFLGWFVSRILKFPELMLCLGGVGTGTKKLRICPMVIADENGEPVMELEQIERQIQRAKEIYATCGIELLASPVQVIRDRPHLAHAPSCGAGGFFSSQAVEYLRLSCCEKGSSLKCLHASGAALWIRNVVKVVWVKEIQGKGIRGCYIPFNSFVQISNLRLPDTLAHELGHACDLPHNTSNRGNLMHVNRNDSLLTPGQCCVLRSSRFVTRW